ncbi:MAG: hypothetical protein M0R80_14895 [Proteobacteria bacterium]|jgi:hypothetical protein|nr:hypothetical protein [Pseudomonadota bacterium]
MKKMIGVFCVFAVFLGAMGSANATVPQLMPVQGVLSDSVGSPIDGPTKLTFRIYNAFDDVTPIWTEIYETTNAVDVQDGFFTVYLGELDPSGNPLVIDWGAPEQWLGITVAEDVEMPRIRLASVPFASEAQSCRQFGVLGEDDADDLSVLIDTGCPPDTAFRAFDGAGGLICDPDDTGAGGGITVVNGTAPITASTVGGTVTVGVTTGTTAGTVATGNHAHAGVYVPWRTCTTGYVLKYDGDSWECATDIDTNTTYAAGTGLTLTGTSFSVNYGTAAGTAAAGNHDHAAAYAPISHNHDAAYVNVTGDAMTGALSISTPNGAYAIDATSANWITINAATTNSSGYPIYGQGGYAGVRGNAGSGGIGGVYGQGYTTTTGTGVYGVGATGVLGTTAAATGYGVYGTATSSTGVNYGVYGTTASTTNGWAGYFDGRTYAGSLIVDGPAMINGTAIATGFDYASPQTGYAALASGAFTTNASSDAYDGAGNGTYRFIPTGATGTELVAALTLPHGVTVTNMTCYVYDNHATYNVAAIGVVDTLDNTWKCYDDTITSGQSATVQAISSDCSFVVDNANDLLNVRWIIDDAACGEACQLHGCIFTYTYMAAGR